MCRSWGFGVPKTTLAILVSGIWNVFLKLGLPIIALVLLVAEGRATGGLVGAAIFGLAVLVVAVPGPHPGAAQRPAGHRSSGAWPSGSCRSRFALARRPDHPGVPRGRARLPPSHQRADLTVLAPPDVVDAVVLPAAVRVAAAVPAPAGRDVAGHHPGVRRLRLRPTAVHRPHHPERRRLRRRHRHRRPGGLRRRSGRLHGRRAAVHRLHLPAGDPGRRHLVGGVEPDERAGANRSRPRPTPPPRPPREGRPDQRSDATAVTVSPAGTVTGPR